MDPFSRSRGNPDGRPNPLERPHNEVKVNMKVLISTPHHAEAAHISGETK